MSGLMGGMMVDGESQLGAQRMKQLWREEGLGALTSQLACSINNQREGFLDREQTLI